MRLKSTRFLHLIGKTINGLKITDIIYGELKSRKAAAKIDCSWCGKEGLVCASQLEKGIVKSCGCDQNPRPKGIDNKKTKDLTGLKFGKLSVLKFSERKNGRLYWSCLCECGGTKDVQGINLTQGEVSSCGCLTRRVGLDNPLYTGVGEFSGHKFYQIKRAAEIRNIDFCLTKEEIWDIFLLQERKCALTGEVLSIEDASLDRIDSSLGYTPENVQWVHKFVNIMKWDLSQDEFIKICQKVSKHHL